MVSQAEIVRHLMSIERWSDSKLQYEQYDTSAELAAQILVSASELCDSSFAGKSVVDLGCGSGVLGIGCSLMGARKVTFVDIDPDCLDICRRNCANLDNECEFEFIQADVAAGRFLSAGCADIVIMNPPFGSLRTTKGIDFRFVWEGLRLVAGKEDGWVFSLHDAHTFDRKDPHGSTVTAKTARLSRKLPADCTDADAAGYPPRALGRVLGVMTWPLPPTYSHHTSGKSVNISVALLASKAHE